MSDRWTGVNLLILIICLKILSHHHHCNDDQDHYGDDDDDDMNDDKDDISDEDRNAGSTGRCSQWLPLNIVMCHERPFALKSILLYYRTL